MTSGKALCESHSRYVYPGFALPFTGHRLLW